MKPMSSSYNIRDNVQRLWKKKTGMGEAIHVSSPMQCQNHWPDRMPVY